jgi:PPOX class probable F420-dependent enzyme
VTDLDDFVRLAAADHGLCVLATTRGDGSVQASVVNAGVLAHPLTGLRVVACVARGGSAKLANLRDRAHATFVARHGWEWAAVEGPVQLWGPDDPIPGGDHEALTRALRAVFEAAGGVHDDWPDYDRVMAEERRSIVLLAPERVYSNPARPNR